MENRNSNNNDLGCLGAMLGLLGSILLLLFTSESPGARKAGWCIIGVIAAIWVLADAGVSGEGILIIIIIGFAAIIFFSIIKLCGGTGSENKGKNDTYIPPNGTNCNEEAFNKDIDVKADINNKSIDRAILKNKAENIAPIKEEYETFDELLEKVRTESDEVKKLMK